jgi:hypothetical protein
VFEPVKPFLRQLRTAIAVHHPAMGERTMSATRLSCLLTISAIVFAFAAPAQAASLQSGYQTGGSQIKADKAEISSYQSGGHGHNDRKAGDFETGTHGAGGGGGAGKTEFKTDAISLESGRKKPIKCLHACATGEH